MKYEFLVLTISIYKKMRRAWKLDDKEIPKWQTDPACLLKPFMDALGLEGWMLAGIGYNALFFQRQLPKE